jgi:hypothetical protein
MGNPAVEADRDVPALIVKIGQYPLHSGGVGAIRALGRLGVPVYAMTKDRFTPASASRYLKGQFRSEATGREDPGKLRRLVVEHIDLPARLAYRGSGYPARPEPPRTAPTELAWLASDDPLPFLAMLPRLAKPVATRLTRKRRPAAVRPTPERPSR